MTLYRKRRHSAHPKRFQISLENQNKGESEEEEQKEGDNRNIDLPAQSLEECAICLDQKISVVLKECCVRLKSNFHSTLSVINA